MPVYIKREIAFGHYLQSNFQVKINNCSTSGGLKQIHVCNDGNLNTQLKKFPFQCSVPFEVHDIFNVFIPIIMSIKIIQKKMRAHHIITTCLYTRHRMGRGGSLKASQP